MGLSEFLRKTFVSQTSRAREAGQAVIEYLLVLIVTLSLILGLMYQFNDAFKQFLDTYFGDYIACLLETGELPSLGGQGPNQSECRSPFGDFDVQAGKSLDPGAGEGGGGSSSSGSSDSGSGGDGESSSGSRSRNLSPSRVSRSGGSANGEFSGSANSRSGSPSRQRMSSQSDSSSKSGFESNSSEGSLRGRGGRTIRRKKVIYLGESYLSEKEKKKRGSSTLGKAQKAKKGGGPSGLRKPTFALEVPKAKNINQDEMSTGFNFATLIKFMLIAGILIAIFLFLGGQAMQIKKSWEKSE